MSSRGSLPPLNQSQCIFYGKLKLCFSQCSLLPDATVAPLFSSSLTTSRRQNDVSTGRGQQTDANAAEKVETCVEMKNAGTGQPSPAGWSISLSATR